MSFCDFKKATSFRIACINLCLSASVKRVKSLLAQEAIKKFMSFKVVEFLVFPLTCLSTVLPFKSNMYLRFSDFFSLIVFSIRKKCTCPVYFVLIVNTPNTFESKLNLFSLQWFKQSGIIGRKYSSSNWVMVFTMNFRSWEKKKKLPLRPAPSPDLKI